jgi:hypothetical protein
MVVFWHVQLTQDWRKQYGVGVGQIDLHAFSSQADPVQDPHRAGYVAMTIALSMNLLE